MRTTLGVESGTSKAPQPPEGGPGPWYALTRLLWLTAGRDAATRALPAYLGLFIAASVAFGGNGLRARQVTESAEQSLPFRAVLWALWLLVSTPAARSLIEAPGAFWLRTLPLPRWQQLGVLAAMLVVAELPWFALWARGAGPLGGLSALAGGLAAHALLVARSRRAADLASAAGLLALFGLGAPPLARLAGGAAAFAIGLRSAWLQAPERGARARAPFVGGPAPVALGLAHAVLLARGHGSLLLRALLLTTLGSLAAFAWARHAPSIGTGELAALSLGILAPPSLLASAGVAGPVLREERRLRWLLDAYGAGALLRVGAAASTTGAIGAALGTLHGIALGALLGIAPGAGLRLAVEGAFGGLSLGVLAASTVRWAARGDGRDGGRMIRALFGAAIVVSASATMVGSIALAAWTITALLSIVATSWPRSPRPRPAP